MFSTRRLYPITTPPPPICTNFHSFLHNRLNVLWYVQKLCMNNIILLIAPLHTYLFDFIFIIRWFCSSQHSIAKIKKKIKNCQWRNGISLYNLFTAFTQNYNKFVCVFGMASNKTTISPCLFIYASIWK